MRKLGPDEAALWSRVAATIRPIGAKAADFPEATRGPGPVLPDLHPPERQAARPKARIGASLDGSWDKRLRTGAIDPDRTLDLHGYKLDTAWQAIDRLLDRAWLAEERLVLLVTGRERPKGENAGRGRIRAAVRDWLAASRHAPHIAAIREAHARHGGAGGLYIILRRR